MEITRKFCRIFEIKIKELGYQTWFDKEQMVDDTDVKMSHGIEQ